MRPDIWTHVKIRTKRFSLEGKTKYDAEDIPKEASGSLSELSKTCKLASWPAAMDIHFRDFAPVVKGAVGS